MFIFLFAVSGVGLTYFMKYNYPNLVMSFMYQCVYYYSFLEMLYLKHLKQFKPLTSTSTSAIEFVKNGKKVDTYDCNFIIYSQNNDKQLMNKERTFIKSSVSFILFNIVLNNTTISLKLSDDDYNYYLVGNVIDSQFLWYFLNKHYNLGLTEPLMNYTLNVIDNNVNIYTITYPECFEITADGIRVFGKITNNMTFDQFEMENELCVKVKEERKEELEEGKERHVDKEKDEAEERKDDDVNKEKDEVEEVDDFVKETI